MGIAIDHWLTIVTQTVIAVRFVNLLARFFLHQAICDLIIDTSMGI
jgi:hypothetical protein